MPTVAQRRASRARPQVIVNKSAEAVSSSDPVVSKVEEAPTCRLCWAEADTDREGELLSPCSCSGSLRFIHKRCLHDWQRTLRSQGLSRRAMHCELCQAPYRLPDFASESPGRPQNLPQQLLHAIRQMLFDSVYCSSWPLLILKAWRGYVMLTGVLQGVRLGAAGFNAGLKIGKLLIEQQTSLLTNILCSMSAFFGSPYAELLWCQAVGALIVGMLSELVYTSVLGLLGGLAYGFCRGYVSAIKQTVQLLSKGGCHLAAGFLRVVSVGLKHILSAVARV